MVCNDQYGFIPRADVLWPAQIAVDTDRWAPGLTRGSGADGRIGEVVVVHARNHRGIKGTQQLIEAVTACGRKVCGCDWS